MARSTVGLDIGTSAVRAAEVTGKNPPTLVRFGQVALPEGAVEAGEVTDAEAVSEAIRDLWRRGGFKSKRVATAIANQKAVVRQIEMPYMEPAELRGALQFQVAEYIPFPIDQAILDYTILEEFSLEEGGRMMRVLVVAAVREMIDPFVEAIQGGGLTPVVIDYAAFAALRAIVGPPGGFEAEVATAALVDIGSGVTTVLVHQGSTPRFVRLLPVGGGDVTKALASRLSLPPEEAEQQKMRLGLPEEAAGEPAGAAAIIEGEIASFLDEIRSSLDYFQTQPGAEPISRVVIVGGGSRLPRLAERMSASLRLPVEEGQPLANVKLGRLGLSPEQLDQASAVAAVSVGLALGEL